MSMHPNPAVQFLMDFMSGGIAGAVAKTVCAPVERVKLLMQTQTMNKKLDKQYSGITDCFLRCYRQDGALSLWRGNSVNVMRYFPTQALNFSFKDKIQKFFHTDATHQSKQRFLFQNIAAGGLAGCMTMFFVYPLDIARTRLAVDLGKSLDQRQFKGARDCITQVIVLLLQKYKQIYSRDGIRGLYQGIGICLAGVFIYRGFQFGLYDTGKELVIKKMEKPSLIKKFFFAQAIVIISETIRLMMQSGEVKLFKNSFQLFQHIRKTEGIQSLMKGCASNILRSIGSTLCLLLYDEMKKLQEYTH